MKNRVGSQAEVLYARGYVGDPTGEYNGVQTGQDLKDDRSEDELLAEAVEVSKDADYVIFFGGLNKSNHQDCEDSDPCIPWVAVCAGQSDWRVGKSK